MALPRFDFAPHEWPPLAIGEREGVADAVFWTNWNGERVEVMARWIALEHRSAYLFFQATRSGSLFIVSREQSFGIWPWARVCMDGQSRAKLAVKLVEKALRGWGCSYGQGICFPLGVGNISRAQWLFLRHDGSGGVWNDWHRELHQAPFRLARAGESLPALLADPGSTIRFALDWSQLSHEERLQRAFALRTGECAELRRVVQSIARVEPTLHRLAGQGRLFFDEDLYVSWRHPWGWERETSNARLRRWQVHLRRAFAWKKDEELAQGHLCVELFHSWPRADVELSPPSHHEHLEAALFLRDWARGKIPPDELRLLLPKL